MSFDLKHYLIRRKVLKLFGASFHIFDRAGRVVGFSRQKAFKLKEDIRIFLDTTQTTELLAIQARQVIDFSAAYDVVDSVEQRKVGAARRKGWSSLVRDSWELLDAEDRPVATLREDSTALALLRRFLSNLIPQKFHLVSREGREEALLRVRFNPFVYKLSVDVADDCTVDARLVLAAAVLLAAIEGRQE
ncbi:MAG: hypothetical protein ACYTEZ_03320 [Planctomycetota bacterium]|jgi:hypothetical protein